jgi:hypothetical protein
VHWLLIAYKRSDTMQLRTPSPKRLTAVAANGATVADCPGANCTEASTDKVLSIGK